MHVSQVRRPRRLNNRDDDHQTEHRRRDEACSAVEGRRAGVQNPLENESRLLAEPTLSAPILYALPSLPCHVRSSRASLAIGEAAPRRPVRSDERRPPNRSTWAGTPYIPVAKASDVEP